MNPFLSLCQNVSRLGVMAVVAMSILVSCAKKQSAEEPNPNNLFTYENSDILYSMKRIVEYGGEEIPVTMYWDIEEFLMPGTYKADIFADGHHIGSNSFVMEN